MTLKRIDTEEFGLCLNQQEAMRYLNRQGVPTCIEQGGAMVFHYPSQAERRVLPVDIHNKGRFYPVLELSRGYTKPLPEVRHIGRRCLVRLHGRVVIGRLTSEPFLHNGELVARVDAGLLGAPALKSIALFPDGFDDSEWLPCHVDPRVSTVGRPLHPKSVCNFVALALEGKSYYVVRVPERPGIFDAYEAVCHVDEVKRVLSFSGELTISGVHDHEFSIITGGTQLDNTPFPIDVENALWSRAQQIFNDEMDTRKQLYMNQWTPPDGSEG